MHSPTFPVVSILSSFLLEHMTKDTFLVTQVRGIYMSSNPDIMPKKKAFVFMIRCKKISIFISMSSPFCTLATGNCWKTTA